MNSKLLRGLSAIALVLVLSTPAFAQVGNNVRGAAKGGAGGGSGDFTGPASSTADNFVGFSGTGGKTGKDSGYGPTSFSPAGVVSIITSSNPTTNAASWAAFTQYTIAGSGRTITLPASSGLSANGGLLIDANGATATLQANAADTITYNGVTTSAGGSVSLLMGGLYAISTDGAGAIYVSAAPIGPVPQYRANGWFPIQNTLGATGTAQSNTIIHWQPFYVWKASTWTDWYVRVTTLSASGNLYLACADSTGNNGLPAGPGTILGSMTTAGGGISENTAGQSNKAMTCAFPAPGWYWMGSISDNTTAVIYAISSASANQAYYFGGTGTSSFGGSGTSYSTDYQTTGATPGTWTNNPAISFGSTANTPIPLITGKIGSIP